MIRAAYFVQDSNIWRRPENHPVPFLPYESVTRRIEDTGAQSKFRMFDYFEMCLFYRFFQPGMY